MTYLNESAKKYNALKMKLSKAKTSKEKSSIKKEMESIRQSMKAGKVSSNKVSQKVESPKQEKTVKSGRVGGPKKGEQNEEIGVLDRVLKGQFPWGGVSKETAKIFRSKLMTIPKPVDRDRALKHALKSPQHFEDVLHGKPIK